jgi:glutamate formiminotransferase
VGLQEGEESAERAQDDSLVNDRGGRGVLQPDAPADGTGLDDLSQPIALAVPNVSEGRDAGVIEELAQTMRASGLRVLDIHSDTDHHRSVYTVAAHPMIMVDGLLALARASVELIDLRRHRGMHPRVGSLDVVPLVALEPEDMAMAREVAATLAERIGWELDVPVFRYGTVAAHPDRSRPHHFRSGGLDALDEAIREERLVPDAGPSHLHATAGATLVGARPALIALNVWLAEGGLSEARAIAARVRESGGGLPTLRAMGLYLPDAGVAQVSMNLEDFRRTSPADAVAAVREEAERLGAVAGRSELVGLIPRAALSGASPSALGLRGFRPGQVLEAQLPALRNR